MVINVESNFVDKYLFIPKYILKQNNQFTSEFLSYRELEPPAFRTLCPDGLRALNWDLGTGVS